MGNDQKRNQGSITRSFQPSTFNFQPLKKTLIIGAGITGVTAAVELAETGCDVILVEKESYLGGNVVRMHNYFPKLCPPACGMELNFRRIKNNNRVKVMTSSEVAEVSGSEGNFRVRIKTAPAVVNDNCTACGECIDVCPAQRPDAFSHNIGLTKAIYLPYALAYPQKFTIDDQYCDGEACAKCVEACIYNAIDLKAKETEQEIEVSTVIAATGWKNYDASRISRLNYNNSLDIVSNVEFERLLDGAGSTDGKLVRPSDGKAPKSIAFVQCAGSRDENHLPYCSGVCCSASLKHALNVAEAYPDTKVSIHYIDLRVSGRNEVFLQRVEEKKNIDLIKGKVASIEIDDEKKLLHIEAEEIGAGRKTRFPVEMVVLATGIEPEGIVPGMATNEDGFFNSSQPDGLLVAGCAKKPMDVSASVKDGTAAAMRALSHCHIKTLSH